jgi:2-C-methyl-D-erythritol 4-phosphate cytidylyltransferase/2-C-methyl-D-erythritol 2,4-cyclodiphosphate synthase
LSEDGPRGGGCDVIVVAAGRSTRMAGVDKIEEPIGGRPLLAWTLEALSISGVVDRIVVVTAAERVADVRAASWLPAAVVAVVAGGGRRHESVAAGLAAIDRVDVGAEGSAAGDADRVLLIHDGARPLVSPSLIRTVAAAAAEQGAAIPVLPISETVKRVVDGGVVETVDRSTLAAAQTPQGVRRGLLRAAFDRFPPEGPQAWTDEAALLEACRIAVHALPGDPGNLKVTLPVDLDRVRAALAADGHPGAAVRVGLGSDSHPFGPGAPLALGGVIIEGAPRLFGHSDGDVALHAVADALLGAAGLGDLGRLFPAGPETPAGVASGELLQTVVARVGEAGYRPVAVDLTIVAARPRLAGLLDAMAATIAAVLGIATSAVKVKASTGNQTGMDGAGRVISAHAVATVDRTP